MVLDLGPATPPEIMEAITANIQRTISDLNEFFPPSREKALAITKLDEARLWAKEMKI